MHGVVADEDTRAPVGGRCGDDVVGLLDPQVIQDREVQTAEEMASYWRLFRWARAEPSAELEKRARRDLSAPCCRPFLAVPQGQATSPPVPDRD